MDKKKVLGISFGRKMGNTDVMIKTALMECEKAGCKVRFIRADDLNIQLYRVHLLCSRYDHRTWKGRLSCERRFLFIRRSLTGL